ncbi:MAG: GtrA family protein, partial [Nitrososphaerales archaeon]
PSTPGISKILKSGLDYARLSNCMFLSRKYAIHVAETEGIASSTNARKQGFRALSMISFTTHSPREAIAEFTFVRFAIVGFSGFVVNELVVSVFKFWIPSINLVMGDALGIELSIINNFIWNDIYTFKSARETNPVNSSRERVIRFLKYNLVSLSSTFVNLTVFYYLYSTLGIFYFWSLFIAIITAFVINYVGSARWAWSKFTRSKLIPTPLND